jgi:hypothetical protein
VTYTTSTSNLCQVCATGFYVNTITNECLAQSINNCAIYASNANLCNVCDSTFYLASSLTCLPQNILNCAVFVPNANECTQCAAGFFLSASNVCTVQSVLFCATFDPASNVCLACIAGYYLGAPDLCLAQSVANCVTYLSNTGVCQVCDAGTTLNIGTNTCDPSNAVDSIMHCLARNNSACLLCEVNYRPINDDTACVFYPDVELQLTSDNLYLDYFDTNPSTYTPRSSATNPASSGRYIYVTGEYNVYDISDPNFNMFLYDAGNGVAAYLNVITYLFDLTPAQHWRFSLAPGTTDQFIVQNTLTGNYLTSWTTVGPVPVPIRRSYF